MAFIPSLVRAAFTYFKADPRKALNIVMAAIGYLSVAAAVIDQAIAVLKQVTLGLQ